MYRESNSKIGQFSFLFLDQQKVEENKEHIHFEEVKTKTILSNYLSYKFNSSWTRSRTGIMSSEYPPTHHTIL